MRNTIVAILVTVTACGVDSAPPGDDANPPCAAAGTFHQQTLVVDGETRSYYLHVPPSYDCTRGTALLVDFHGTGFDTMDGTPPNELWATGGLEQASDKLGFIVARPLSQHFTDPADGQVVYHWDSHPGDLARNKVMASALIDALASEYTIDRGRVYASGFSNGTNMVAQFVGDAAPFTGFGFVGGGIWETYPAQLAGATTRVYQTTGYRDQLRPESLVSDRWFAEQGYPASQVFVRETNAGHELYGWQFEEMFRWFDEGVRPPAGTLAAGWSSDGFSNPARSVLHLAAGAQGALFASGTGGRVWQRSVAGAWSEAVSLLPAQPTLALDGICVTPGGNVVTTGDGAVGVFANGAWQVNPTAGRTANEEERLEAVACLDDTRIVGGGPSYAAASADLGTTWGAADISIFGGTPSVSNVVRGPSGTSVALGAYYLGRSTDGVAFTVIDYPTSATWMYGLASGAAGQWWAVGESGTVLVSHDDARTWQPVTVPTTEDLYAVSFADASRGLAVGLHGAAILTTDGGVTWHDVATGLDAMNSDVAWLDASTVLVVGGGGTAIRRSVP